MELAGARVDEVVEANGAELALEERDVEIGQEDPGSAVDVAGEPLRIEVIAVRVRDVEVVGAAEV